VYEKRERKSKDSVAHKRFPTVMYGARIYSTKRLRMKACSGSKSHVFKMSGHPKRRSLKTLDCPSKLKMGAFYSFFSPSLPAASADGGAFIPSSCCPGATRGNAGGSRNGLSPAVCESGAFFHESRDKADAG
jgi:hypothetical protein